MEEVLLALAAWVDQHSNMMTLMECDSLVFSKEGEMVDFAQRQGLSPIKLSSRVGWLMVWLVDQWPMDRKDSQRGKGEEDGRVTSMLHRANPMIASCDGQRSEAVIPVSVVNCVMQDIVESFSGERGRVRWAEGWRVEQMDFFLLELDYRVIFFC